MKKQPDINGKTIIIIGASGGIGSVLAKVFCGAGANVTLSARTEHKLLALQDTLKGSQTLVAPADATNAQEIEKVFMLTKEAFGAVDAVVIAAGTWKQLGINSPIDDALDLAEHHYRALFLPTFVVGFVAQQFFRSQGYGLIVNISSHAALRPELADNLTYGPMKSAARHFMLALDHALKGTGVRISDLAPAIVNTPDAALFLNTEEKRLKAVQPEAIAEWIMEHFNDPAIPSSQLFDSELVM